MRSVASTAAKAWLLAASLTTSLCLAHSHLLASTPGEGSALAQPPEHLELAFSEPARLTALYLQKGDGRKTPVKFTSGAPSQRIAVALPRLAPGTYIVSYRIVSADSHVTGGTIHFSVMAP